MEEIKQAGNIDMPGEKEENSTSEPHQGAIPGCNDSFAEIAD